MGWRADQDSASGGQQIRIGQRFVIAFEPRRRVDHIANDGVLKAIVAADASGRHLPGVDTRAHAYRGKSGRLPVAS